MTVKFEADSKRWLTMGYRPLELEQKIREFWEKSHTAEKLEQLRLKKNKGFLGYVEGPPTLNGYPHVGHVRGRVMKDLRYRWKSMQGFYVPFWTGWDCQGLPVELEVERQLGVKNKKDLLERVGEERFVAECKKAIMKYYDAWHGADVKAGVFINDTKAYWTYLDEYIEREWNYLKRAWEQGLLGEGYYVVAYCPHCQTSLSNAEVGMGYEEVEDPSLYFKFRVAKTKNEYFLVWTTMPFTLVTDLMLAVHPDAEYVKVKVKDETWIMVSQRVEPTMQELEIQDYTVIDAVLGKELEGMKYEYPFLDVVPKQRELDKHPFVHMVVCEDFVDVTAATGVVHLAPGNGEEDFVVAQKRKVPVFAPFDDEVNFTKDAGVFAGLFARDADDVVVEKLQKKNLLVSVKRIRHEYPTCWRSHHKLVWFARREYYLWTNKINDRIVRAAEKARYYYGPPKNRFLAFLRESKPWCFSRERVWGTPLPVWKCTQCEHKVLVSSKKELFEKALGRPKGHFELHKPWIDRIVFKCEKCGGKMHREPFVLDTWHNSGAAPYARFTDEEFERYVPTDFLVEAIDQTRGWANTLLLEHVILAEKAESPYKAFLFYGHALDEKGRKMSKSLGNVIDANDVLGKYSADLFRFYMLWKCSPIDSMNFDVKELSKRPYQVLSTLYHLYRFFMQNAEYDSFDPLKHTLEWAKVNNTLKLPDSWLLSKLQSTVKRVTEKFESCEFNFALSDLEEFVVNFLSRQYVPMVRHELWSDDQETRNRRLTVYATLWQTLKTLNLLFNPITPFLCEAMYQQVHKKLDKTLLESVNFEEWPTLNEKLADLELERNFDVLLKYVSLTYSARQKVKLKRRWPLKKVVLAGSKNAQNAVKELEDLFLELANVKAVDYVDTLAEMSLEMRKNGSLASENNMHTLVDTRRDEALLGEGLMRDLARRVQALRRELGFMPTEVLEAVYLAELDAESTKLLRPHLKTMAELVRTKRVHLQRARSKLEAEWNEYRLDNKKVFVAIP
ncbi:MAG: isoleucine--tRNA ligase [Candidatus Bathyarchaeota archaeon]|nr:isoleucine--tRNA ligase [Candidatus Bathyarchaeota archaeon]MDH5494482.1 isoleucine--tRNA ligase [Candidatus Bathyarchaeota archaeon]